MAILDITLNNGQRLKVGQVAHFGPDLVEDVSTYHPMTTTQPDMLWYDDLWPFVQNLPYYNYNISRWGDFRTNTYTSMDAVDTAINSDRYYNTVVQSTYWMLGSPNKGGVGIMRTSENGYMIVYINGYKSVEGGVAPNLANEYPVGQYFNENRNYTITNSGDYGPVAPIVPPTGTYKSALSFYNVFDWDDEAKLLRDTNTLQVMVQTHLSRAKAGYEDGGTGIVPLITIKTFGCDGSYLRSDWDFNFTDQLPTVLPDMFDLLFQVPRKKQFHWTGGVGSISFDLNQPYVADTSLFGGPVPNSGPGTDNPYDDGTGPGGGGGYQNRYSQDTLPEGIPSLDLLNSGFVKIYNPSKAQLSDFASFLFSGITESAVDVFKRMMTNPIDYILFLNMYHIPMNSAAAAEIGFCGVGSGVLANVVNKQYYEIEYILNIKEFWGSALDYTNYTRAKIYIPYCGMYDINIDEFQDGTMFLRYVVDICSGSCIAFLGTRREQKDGTPLRAVLYQFNGNCALSMPVSSTDWRNTFQSIMSIASMAIAPSTSAVTGIASEIMGQKVSVQKSGSLSANFGYLGKQTPYVIFERPELSLPYNYGYHEGYPANFKKKLSDVSGYTEIKDGTLISNNFTGTDEELDMLSNILTGGVYL